MNTEYKIGQYVSFIFLLCTFFISFILTAVNGVFLSMYLIYATLHVFMYSPFSFAVRS